MIEFYYNISQLHCCFFKLMYVLYKSQKRKTYRTGMANPRDTCHLWQNIFGTLRTSAFSKFIKFSIWFRWKYFSLFPDKWNEIRGNDFPRNLPKRVISNRLKDFQVIAENVQSLNLFVNMESWDWPHILQNIMVKEFFKLVIPFSRYPKTYGQTDMTMFF